MGIDKKTVPTYFNVWIEDTPSHIKAMRKAYQDVGPEDEEPNQLVLCDDGYSSSNEEYYFEDRDNGPELFISFLLTGQEGSVNASISIPLSDTILIDILQHSIKKLNKLKVAMESLK